MKPSAISILKTIIRLQRLEESVSPLDSRANRWLQRQIDAHSRLFERLYSRHYWTEAPTPAPWQKPIKGDLPPGTRLVLADTLTSYRYRISSSTSTFR